MPTSHQKQKPFNYLENSYSSFKTHLLDKPSLMDLTSTLPLMVPTI